MRLVWGIRLAFFCLLAAAIALTQVRPPWEAGKPRWYKGNLHTHTLNSDGDSTPIEVATWYREHGYQFLALTDHNHLTDVAALNATLGAKGKFLLLPAEELTDKYLTKPIHINALNLTRELQAQHGASVADTIRRNIARIRGAQALPSVNHPNFHWAITARDMLGINGLTHFEVYNGHPTVNNYGGGGAPSLDRMWDELLTGGQRLYGISVDDAHIFKRTGQEYSNPGRGWVVVRSAELSAAAITDALARGDFYASSGLNLLDVQITPAAYRTEIDARDTEKFTATVLGEGGKVLATTFDAIPEYKFTGAEKYVRARIDSSFGHSPWTQPVFRR
ncbi:MAG: PHP domain-containing protein [Acidobacteriaceae bacterium]|nr:PHP domain-containing protein [Acidobacteriaceae bacterium]